MRTDDYCFKSLNIGIVCSTVFLKQQISTHSHSLGDLIYFNSLTFVYSEDFQIYISYPELTHVLLAGISSWLSLGGLIEVANLPCPKWNSQFPSETHFSYSHPFRFVARLSFQWFKEKTLNSSSLSLSHTLYTIYQQILFILTST